MTVWQWEHETLVGLWAPNLFNYVIHTTKKQKWRAPEALVQEGHVLLKNNKVDKKK